MDESKESAFSRAVIALMKNPVDQERNPPLWDTVLEQRFHINDYVGRLGLELVVNEIDGYAFLKQRVRADGEEEIGRLIPRRALSYPVSLLLVLLRKRLLEFDTASSEGRLILTKDQMVEMLQLFFKDSTNEVKALREMERHIERVREMGFLRRLKESDDTYEVQRILRSFIDAEWMNELDKRLAEYREALEGALDEDGTRDDSD